MNSWLVFYANWRYSNPCEVETLVLGKRIFLKYNIVDEIFDIRSYGFSFLVKNSWSSYFDVSFEEAQKALISTPSGSLAFQPRP